MLSVPRQEHTPQHFDVPRSHAAHAVCTAAPRHTTGSPQLPTHLMRQDAAAKLVQPPAAGIDCTAGRPEAEPQGFRDASGRFLLPHNPHVQCAIIRAAAAGWAAARTTAVPAAAAGEQVVRLRMRRWRGVVSRGRCRTTAVQQHGKHNLSKQLCQDSGPVLWVLSLGSVCGS